MYVSTQSPADLRNVVVRPSLIEGECVENILPNGRCYADVMTEMRRAVLTIPRDSPRSPFSISPQ